MSATAHPNFHDPATRIAPPHHSARPYFSAIRSKAYSPRQTIAKIDGHLWARWTLGSGRQAAEGSRGGLPPACFFGTGPPAVGVPLARSPYHRPMAGLSSCVGEGRAHGLQERAIGRQAGRTGNGCGRRFSGGAARLSIAKQNRRPSPSSAAAAALRVAAGAGPRRPPPSSP